MNARKSRRPIKWSSRWRVSVRCKRLKSPNRSRRPTGHYSSKVICLRSCMKRQKKPRGSTSCRNGPKQTWRSYRRPSRKPYTSQMATRRSNARTTFRLWTNLRRRSSPSISSFLKHILKVAARLNTSRVSWTSMSSRSRSLRQVTPQWNHKWYSRFRATRTKSTGC